MHEPGLCAEIRRLQTALHCLPRSHREAIQSTNFMLTQNGRSNFFRNIISNLSSRYDTPALFTGILSSSNIPVRATTRAHMVK